MRCFVEATCVGLIERSLLLRLTLKSRSATVPVWKRPLPASNFE